MDFYHMNVTKLKWLENKLQVESEALGKLVTFSPLIHLNLIIRLRFYCNQCVMRIFIWLLIVFYTALYNHFRFSVLEKEKNAKLIREVKVAKEETTQIRANTQQIISTYQVQILDLNPNNIFSRILKKFAQMPLMVSWRTWTLKFGWQISNHCIINIKTL